MPTPVPDEGLVLHAHDPAWDAQSTTGPYPPLEALVPGGEAATSGTEVVIDGVPAYTWRHGCGPTAAGMVIGYWDGHGFDWLISGNASTQTAEINQRIASDLTGSPSHYFDYSLPMDSGSTGLRPDKSSTPPGDEHASDSLADFMRTSWSAADNLYGWSWFTDVSNSLQGYFQWAQPAAPPVSTASVRLGYEPSDDLVNAFWSSYNAEINAGRPAVFLVDSDGNGGTDHFITAVGYDTIQGVRKYAALNTWDKNLHWYNFGPLTRGKTWGIYGMTTLRMNASPVPTLLNLDPPGVLVGSSGLTLTVHGTNYITTSRVLWKGIELATTYVNGTTLTAAVPAGLLASASVASVTVFNPAPLGGTSGSLSFSILNPVPVLTALSPGSVPAGTGDLLLTLTGQGFVPSSAARWNGAPLSTSYIDSTHLTALVPAANLRQPARAVISVSTPGPGGGESNTLDSSVVLSLFLPVTLK